MRDAFTSARSGRLALSLLALTACGPGATADPDAGTRDAAVATRDAATGDDAGSPAPEPFRPELTANRFELVRDDLPAFVWESGVAYDPRTESIVHHGGHVSHRYAQSPYTWRYALREDRFIEATPRARPPRRCLVEVDYLDDAERVVTVQGGASHGSLPAGRIAGWRVVRGDPRGPWLYDAVEDAWAAARPSGTAWPQRIHAQTAYDPASDALFLVGGDALYAYVEHANTVLRHPIPADLAGRSFYGIAFDRDARRLVVFGGTSRPWTYGHLDGDETDNCGVVDQETCNSYYRQYVHSDTWVLDVDAAAASGWADAPSEGALPAGWSHLDEGAGPPRGMPQLNHQRLQLTWHAPSGRVLLLQNDVHEVPLMSPATWSPVRLWAFDAVAMRWDEVPVEEPPHFMGHTTYVADLDVLVTWGGGQRGADAASDTNAATSSTLYLMRPRIGDLPARPPATVDAITATTTTRGVELRFAARAGRRYEIARADADPMAGAFAPLATVEADADPATYVDLTAADAPHAYRVREVGTERWSRPAFDAPRWPGETTADVESATSVRVRWAAVDGAARYAVHRSGPGETRTLVGETASTELLDDGVDLSDGRVRLYTVTAIDPAGRQSGHGPMAYTVADRPTALDVRARADGRLDVTWDAPRDGLALELYYLDYHCNARASIETFLDTFTPVAGGPFEGGAAVIEPPAIDPVARMAAPTAEPGECGRTFHEGHFLYGRFVDRLGQRGLYSGIVSPDDPAYRPAAPGRDM